MLSWIYPLIDCESQKMFHFTFFSIYSHVLSNTYSMPKIWSPLSRLRFIALHFITFNLSFVVVFFTVELKNSLNIDRMNSFQIVKKRVVWVSWNVYQLSVFHTHKLTISTMSWNKKYQKSCYSREFTIRHVLTAIWCWL